MPTYEYKCKDCGHEFERILRLVENKDPQVCPECQSLKTGKIFTTCNFVLKGDGWPSKNYRVGRSMAAKNKRLKVKEDEQKRDAPGVTLAPNVEGERTDTWSEAQKLAASKGKDAESYEPLVRKERSQ